MKCSNCLNDFKESEIQESHDVPCYLFKGNRRERKQQADKYKRRWLCKECHEKYEIKLLKEFFDQLLDYNLHETSIRKNPSIFMGKINNLNEEERQLGVKISLIFSEVYFNE